MLTYRCDVCGKEWPVRKYQRDNKSLFGYASTEVEIGEVSNDKLIEDPSQTCFECLAKIKEAEEKAATDTEAKIKGTTKPPLK
ncbi:hypothetical protein ACFL0F_01445 [Patescibacteria group bacterium]